MKEAMRCHPGVSYPLERVVPAGGITICGVHVAEGTVLGVSAPVIHSDTSIFGEDALEFNPERWLSSDEEHIKRMERHLMTVRYLSFLFVNFGVVISNAKPPCSSSDMVPEPA